MRVQASASFLRLDRCSQARDCCRDGSLAVIQPLWVQKRAEELPSFDSVPPHFAHDVFAPVGVAGIDKKDHPLMFDRETTETEVFTKSRVRNGSIPTDHRWFQCQQNYGKLVEIIWNAASEIKTAIDALGLSWSRPCTRHSGASVGVTGEWRPTASLPRPLRNKLETLTHRAGSLLTQRLQRGKGKESFCVGVCSTQS